MYTVIWEIEVGAASPEEAARKALEVQRNFARVVETFDVIDEQGEVKRVEADFERPAEVRACFDSDLAGFHNCYACRGPIERAPARHIRCPEGAA